MKYTTKYKQTLTQGAEAYVNTHVYHPGNPDRMSAYEVEMDGRDITIHGVEGQVPLSPSDAEALARRCDCLLWHEIQWASSTPGEWTGTVEDPEGWLAYSTDETCLGHYMTLMDLRAGRQCTEIDFLCDLYAMNWIGPTPSADGLQLTALGQQQLELGVWQCGGCRTWGTGHAVCGRCGRDAGVVHG